MLDYYALEDLLSPEERALRQSLRAFVRDEVLPELRELHRQGGYFPAEFMRRMGTLGLFAPHLHGYGCPGRSSIAYGIISQELERGDSGLRSLASVQGSLAMFAIHAFGSEEQKNRWLPLLARGEKLACFALTEAAHGSDPAGMETTARRDGNHIVLNGEKMWIGNGSVADIKVVWAKNEQGKVNGYLVEGGAPGFSATDIEGKFSLRISRTSRLAFNDCRVPAENCLPGAQGLKAALACLSQARFGIAWGVIGAADDCYQTALEYARERCQFDKPIASFQLVQEKLVWMLSEITKAQLLAFQLARLKDAGTIRPQQISLAKRNNVWMALECARKARDILGGIGITDAYPVIRHLMNLETVYTYEGTHDIHTLILGQDITGLSAFA
ncbi:MAG: acyl-CoA dehydrogenase family protein [Candidatus Hydrogenedentes bacterium]|nr:acyl-CoA dehydrogenase family protein [Candidatus Hydrogenedentota bacterium]